MKHIYQALRAAQDQVPALEKDGFADFGSGYSYITAAGAVRAIRPVLAGCGLLAVSTGHEVVEVAGAQVSRLHLLLAHPDSGEELRASFDLPIAPGRGRDASKAAQASITSGLARWLRGLVLAVAADDEEIDSARPTSVKVEPAPAPAAPAPAPKKAPAPAGHAERMARLVGLCACNEDAVAMWATRKKTTAGTSAAQLGTMESLIEHGLEEEAANRLEEDLGRASAKGLEPGAFGAQVIIPWAEDQIPY